MVAIATYLEAITAKFGPNALAYCTIFAVTIVAWLAVNFVTGLFANKPSGKKGKAKETGTQEEKEHIEPMRNFTVKQLAVS